MGDHDFTSHCPMKLYHKRWLTLFTYGRTLFCEYSSSAAPVRRGYVSFVSLATRRSWSCCFEHELIYLTSMAASDVLSTSPDSALNSYHTTFSPHKQVS